MIGSRLAIAELERHDWTRFRCGCGESAEHVSETPKVLINASGEDKLAGLDFSGHLVAEGGLFEAAVPTASVVLAALAGDVTDSARIELIWLLESLVSGDSHYTESERGRDDLGEECRFLAREGLWVILKYVFGSEREEIRNIMLIMDSDIAPRRYYDKFASSARKPRH